MRCSENETRDLAEDRSEAPTEPISSLASALPWALITALRLGDLDPSRFKRERRGGLTLGGAAGGAAAALGALGTHTTALTAALTAALAAARTAAAAVTVAARLLPGM